MEQKIDKEVFDTFFTENYCKVEYATVKEEFEAVAQAGNEIFTQGYEAKNLTKENFILYLTSESYCDFEAIVQEAVDDLNPEIVDAVMDLAETVDNSEEITEKYWEVQELLLKDFLNLLYDQVIVTWK